MVEIIIYLLVGIGLGGLGLYLWLRPRLKITIQKNEDIIEYNQSLKDDCEKLKSHLDTLYNQEHDLEMEIENLAYEKEQIHTDYIILQREKESTKTAIEDLKQQANASAKIFEEQTMELAKSNIEAAMETLRQNYQQAQEDYCKTYQALMSDYAAEYAKSADEQLKKIDELSDTIIELQIKAECAVAAAKRAEEMRAAADFYKLQLSETDLQEIEMLRNVAPYLRDKEPLNKVIWKCYYEKPTTDLIGRVIGSGVHTGIYKITNLENQMCYVGQAASLSDRWKQHIKRGVGAETPTRNKLYPAMFALGPEKFSFEVIEECDRSLLDEREDYWQDFFKAKEFGYSIK